MSLIQIGIVDTTGKLDPELVHAAAAAINVQVIRDLPQFWNIQATVIALPSKSKVPAGVWPVQLVASLPPGEGGFHLTKHHQPYAKVIGTPNDDSWTIDASHEILEMLVDPSGNRLQSAQALTVTNGQIEDAPGQFEYLVEACDPCEANDFAYPIQGIAVSDFLTPHFYDSAVTPGTRYSFRGNLTKPRQILPGGYISWVDPVHDVVQQILFVDSSKPPQLVTLGPATGLSLRAWVDNESSKLTRKHHKANTELMAACKEHRSLLNDFAEAKAKHYQ